MILDSFPTRLYWVGGCGIARLNGEQIKLASCPQIFPGVVIDAMDYAPQTVAMFMPRWGGWADMSGEQREACAQYLRKALWADWPGGGNRETVAAPGVEPGVYGL